MRIRVVMTLGMRCAMAIFHKPGSGKIARALAVMLIQWRLLLLCPDALILPFISLRRTTMHYVVGWRRSVSIGMLLWIRRIMAMAPIPRVWHTRGTGSSIGTRIFRYR